jgi:GMC oxidoreductase
MNSVPEIKLPSARSGDISMSSEHGELMQRHLRDENLPEDPKTSVLDLNCRAHDVDNLYVVEGGFFVSSGAMNPTLTIISNALCVGHHQLGRLGSNITADGRRRNSCVEENRLFTSAATTELTAIG